MTDNTKFSNLNLRPELLGALEALKFTEMTPIQAQSVPFILQGEDLIASQDGSLVYVFDSSGHPLRTLDTITNVVLSQLIQHFFRLIELLTIKDNRRHS